MRNIVLVLFVAMVSALVQAQTPLFYQDAVNFSKLGVKGALATICETDAQQPIVSSATYLWLKDKKCLVFYLNRNAEHCHDLAKNNKASFMVSELTREGMDPNNLPRITFSGQVTQVQSGDRDSQYIRQEYFKKFPEAKTYDGAAAFHEFFFYELKPDQIRYIAGFGRIHDLDPAVFWKTAGD